eukprot:TRINITY_DN37863_c0_g1_i1.p1 TRINITY_DN37863_c0_g1~~TRINITY_DN37863_c0_g1_i1.p1  ORF type:complete len:304 (+),score=49.29 TRINITY_DN37863_c0_g1_i1:15-926(+)
MRICSSALATAGLSSTGFAMACDHAAEHTVPDAESSELEPDYLQEMWSRISESTLDDKKQIELVRKYHVQYTRWKAFQARLMMAISDLGGSEYWDSICRAFSEHDLFGDDASLWTVKDVVCLCLGNLEDNASIYQLALLVLLLEKLGIRYENCLVFDPCHSSEEADILRHLGFKIPEKQPDARIRVRQMTLFYMPHGNFDLVDNLIEANHDSLHFLAILGNDLPWVCNSEENEAFMANCMTSRAPHVQKVLPLVKETHLHDTLAHRVRSQIMNLAPRISKAAYTMVDHLDCTLSTFMTKESRL